MQEFVDAVFSVFPDNILGSFVNNNCLNVIIISIITGIVLLVLGDSVTEVTTLCRKMSIVTSKVLEFFCTLIPLLVFALIIQMMLSGYFESAKGLWLLLLVMIGLNALLAFGSVVAAAIITRESVAVTFRRFLPVLMRSLSTGSTVATFHVMCETEKKDFGVPSSLADFSTAVGMNFLQTPGIITFIPSIIYFANYTELNTGPAWLFMMLIICYLITFAVPPVNGGPLICLTMAFSLCGIPVSNIAIAAPAAVICDFLVAVSRCSAIVAGTTLAARKLGDKIVD